MRQVVENELQARLKESAYFCYCSGVQEGNESRTEALVETRIGTLKRLISRNGRPLDPAQLKHEDERIANLIRKRGDLEKEASEQKEDLQKNQSLLKMLPEAFIYKWESSDGNTARLSFQPNPKFKPTTFEAKIFRAIVGSMLVDRSQNRLIELRGVLSRDLEFGWGILGQLDKGSSLELRQNQIGHGLWVVTFYNLEVNGRAWFFKTIGKRSKESRWGFELVPENLTLEDAANMLKAGCRT